MTRIAGPIAVSYRGLASQAQVNPVATPLQVPIAPKPGLRAAKADNIPTFAAHQVLAGTGLRWQPTEVDGPGSVRRYNPNVTFAGIDTVCGTLQLPREREQLTALSSVTVTRDGTLLFVAGIRDGFVDKLATAKIDGHGALRDVTVSDRYVSWEPPMVASNGVVIAHCGNLMTGLLAGGTLDVKKEELHHGKPTLLRDDLILAANNWDLTLNRVSADGTWTTIDKAPLESRSSGVDSVIVRGDLVIATNCRDLRTFTLEKNKLTLRDQAQVAPADTRLSTPVLAGNVIITTNEDVLHSKLVSDEGKLSPGSTLFCAKNVTAIAVRGNYAVIGSDEGVLAIPFKNDGSFGFAKRFPTGPIGGRPVITADGVVLVGSEDGHVYALQLGADGALTQKAKKHVGSPVRGPLTLTNDGFVLVPTSTGLIALRGKP